MHDACYICCMSIRLHMFALAFFFNTHSIDWTQLWFPLLLEKQSCWKRSAAWPYTKLKLFWDEFFFSLESSRLLRVCLSGLTGWWRLCIFSFFFSSPFLGLVDFFFFLSSFSFFTRCEFGKATGKSTACEIWPYTICLQVSVCFSVSLPNSPLFCSFWIQCTQPLLIS